MAAPTKIWILLAAFCSAAGWILSALGQLNGTGYLLFIVTVSTGFLVWSKRVPVVERLPNQLLVRLHWPRLRRRLRRPLPLAFLVLALLALIGGALYAPNNYDALTYRIPRVLHWLTEGQWHWVHSQNARLNTRVCGIEWLSAPLILFTRTDRWIFLINVLSFLLLPGLIFSCFTRLKISGRVAWSWMWLLPAGYNFALQAGSVGNDSFAAVYALAALDFALRARSSRRDADVWFSILAAALLTGSKLSNLPLLLPWVIALLPSLRLLSARPAISFVVMLLAALASFIPSAALNLSHGANWSGATLEDARFIIKYPLLGVAGNTLILTHQNFAPPFFPWAAAWNEFVPQLLPPQFHAMLTENFESGFLKLGELPNEETAGLGLGACGLLTLSVLAVRFSRHRCSKARTGTIWQVTTPAVCRFQFILRCSFVVALLAFMTQSGLFSPARVIAPYYPFLFAVCLLGPAQASLMRALWWRRLALLVSLLAVAVVILTPSRPLWPAQTILARLHAWKPASRLLERAQTVYFVYAERADSLAPIRQSLPADATMVGFISSGDDPETSLWRPFGTRRIVHVLPGDDLPTLKRQGVNYLIVGSFGLAQNHRQTMEQWLSRHGGEVIGRAALTVKVAQGQREWYVVKLHPLKP